MPSIDIPLINLSILSGVGHYVTATVRFSGEPVPASHIEDAVKLEADAYVEPFEIILNTGAKLYLKRDKTTTWQGHTYEGHGIKIEGVGHYASEETARPKLSLMNPEGVYTYLVDQGLLEGGTVVRYRVLKEHIDADVPVYRRQQWKISRVASLTGKSIVLELRDMADGQLFLTPGGMFIPPLYPTVSLS